MAIVKYLTRPSWLCANEIHNSLQSDSPATWQLRQLMNKMKKHLQTKWLSYMYKS